jgi:hypothetical protein
MELSVKWNSICTINAVEKNIEDMYVSGKKTFKNTSVKNKNRNHFYDF